jgi:hypothetical protein
MLPPSFKKAKRYPLAVQSEFYNDEFAADKPGTLASCFLPVWLEYFSPRHFSLADAVTLL